MSFARIYQYLLSRGRITPAQLYELMEQQGEVEAAEYALRFEHIRAADVRQIEIAQRKLKLPFLRAAMDLGLMTQEQVERVREAQCSDSGGLGQRLEALGLLSREEVDEAMRGFMNDQVRFAEAAMLLAPDIPHRSAILRLFEVTSEMFTRHWEMDVQALAVDVRSDTLELADHNAHIALHGAVAMGYYLGVSRACADAAALDLLGAPSASGDERDDIVRELANVSCGQGLGALVTQGLRMEMRPPTSVASPVSLGAHRAVRVELMTRFGPARIAIAFAFAT